MSGPFADVLLELLVHLGVHQARGVTGGPIARFVHALECSRVVRWIMCRTEGGAVFQAIGAWLATRRPVLVVTTSGPGLLGTRQALEVARSEGVQLVLVSPRTPAAHRGRHVPQAAEDVAGADYFVAGSLFDVVVALESTDELLPLAAELSAGFSRPEGFLAHVLVPGDVLGQPAALPPVPERRAAVLAPEPATWDDVVGRLAAHTFFVIVGKGARPYSAGVRAFLERTGAPVVSTSTGRGVVDERSAGFLGGVGIGAHRDVADRLRADAPAYGLVLGSGLSGASVSWDLVSIPTRGLIHIDRDPHAMGGAWPVPTLAVQADLGVALDALLGRADRFVRRSGDGGTSPVPAGPPNGPARPGVVRPQFLMDVVQRLVVDATPARLFLDVGSTWPWATECLAIPGPDRWHHEVKVGSMGRAFAAAVGAATASGVKAVALTGDWAADMTWPELRTAVDHDAPVVWIVLNSAGGQMVIDGDRYIWQQTESSAAFRRGDMAAAARALSADGQLVTDEEDLDAAVADAMAATGPFLLDVTVDTSVPPNYGPRFSQLR